MKKLLAVLVVLTIAASMAFAGGNQAQTQQKSLITVGFAQCKADESDWRMANTRSMMEAFNHPDYRLIIADSNNDAAKQISDVQGFINQGVDYIIIAAVNEAGWDTVLRNAQQAGIPVILMDRTVTAPENLWAVWVGANFRKEGDMAMEWIAKRFGNNPVNIVHLQGQLGASAQVGRTEALNAAVAGHANWTLLGQQTGDWGTDTAKTIMTSWIRQHGNNINAVFAENDNMALGAIQALREAGIAVGGTNGVAIATVDANRWSVQMTLEGAINVNVECNPLLGPAAFQTIENLRQGRTVAKRTTVEPQAFYFDTLTAEIVRNRPY